MSYNSMTNGTSTLQSLYGQARKLLVTVGSSLSRLESSTSQGKGTSYGAHGTTPGGGGLGAAENQKNVVAKQLQELHRVCRELEGQSAMIGMTLSVQNQHVWKKKIDQVVEETGLLQRSFDRWCGTYRALSMEEEQRQELFLLRRKGGAALGAGDIESSSFRDKERIRRSKQVVEEAYQNGVGALVAMAQQRDVLKNAHRKVLDVLNTIGMSDSVLRIAERRISVDKMIAYGGMSLVILFLVIVWWYTVR